MLQQTRVETVLRYYEPFLQRFPDVSSLARARHETVLKRWEGLGYYRRIVHLHDAAKMLVRRDEGVPASAAKLRELPGVGEYTAAAIASIAYDEPVAAVDGNVTRVLSRLASTETPPSTPTVRKRVQALAQSLLSKDRPGDFNQAWMDLGSAVCVPGRPRCSTCPLHKLCVTAQFGVGPRRRVRQSGRTRASPVVHILAVVFRRAHRFLVRRRARGGLWSGLWELPNVVFEGEEVAVASAHKLAGEEGVRIETAFRPCGTLRHELTHRRIVFHVFEAEVIATPNPGVAAGRAWVSLAGFGRLPVSTAHRKLVPLANDAIRPVPAPGARERANRRRAVYTERRTR